MLKDSKASFTIEGESPKSKRAARWGNAIGQAGLNELTKDELVRLQDLVIENGRFIHMGLRVQGGFRKGLKMYKERNGGITVYTGGSQPF